MTPAGRPDGPPPDDPFQAQDPGQLHPALVPRDEGVAWSALGSLLGGPVVWGGVGWLLDRLLGTSPLFLAAGAVVGSLTGFWIVYVRFGRDQGGDPPGPGPHAA